MMGHRQFEQVALFYEFSVERHQSPTCGTYSHRATSRRLTYDVRVRSACPSIPDISLHCGKRRKVAKNNDRSKHDFSLDPSIS
jgi:hypothetical protein